MNASGYRVTVTLDNKEQRQTSTFTEFGDANRWAMGYLRGLTVGREAWVTHNATGEIVASYMTGPTGLPRVSARAVRS